MKRDHKLVRLLLSVERLEDRLYMSSMAIDTPLIKPDVGDLALAWIR
jgi:hypothetical protein